MISVIIPTLNEEKYLEATLCSIPKGGHEIIVVDGGSSDQTVRIAKRFADKAIMAEGGVSKARNLGAQKAHGDVLLFLDADTRLLPETIESMMEAFDNGAIGVCANISSDGPIYARILYKLVSATAMLTAFMGVPLFYGMCMAWRRDAFESVGGFDESVRVGED